MARRYESEASPSTTEETAARRIDHSTARAFAAALAALAISSLVVSTSSHALTSQGTVARNSLDAGTISLTDDDANQSLVDFQDMGPGQPREQCIRVTYDGSITPVELTIVADAIGDLAPHVLVAIDAGTGAGFGDCEGFESHGPVFSGRLSELEEIGPLPLGDMHNSGESRSFRFVFELADEQEAIGRSSTVQFSWEASPA